MSSRSRSDYLDKLGSNRTSSLGNSRYEDLLSTSHMRTTSGIGSLYPIKTLPVKAGTYASTGTGLGSTCLRKSLSGVSSTGSPMSATGHRPPSKAQKTSSGGSFEDEGSDRGRFTSPARSVNRSISTGRAASFAADRPGSTSRSGPGAGLSAYTASSSAAPLQSFHTLPSTRITRSSGVSGAYPPSPPLPSSKPTALGSPSSQSSRLQASALSITSNSQQFDKVYAAYTDPAGRPSARRSISVGRRTSSDIAASVGRAGDLGIGSLGARSQPLQPLTSATAAGETRATAAGLAHSSSRSKAYQETASSSMQPAQQDAEMRVGADARMHAYPSSMSTSSVAGRSSLIGRRGSRSLLQDEGLSTRVQVRAGGMTPSISESASELSSGAPVLSRSDHILTSKRVSEMKARQSVQCRQSSTSSSSTYQTTYQSAYSSPASGLRRLSFKHDTHGDRLTPSSYPDLIPAVPSGSGRISLGLLQDVQPIGSSPASGKALITAALSKMGLSSMRSTKGFVGLNNLGNTCFANSVMQCLVAIPELVSFFLSTSASAEQGSCAGPVSGAFGKLVQELWASYATAVDPYLFMKACGSHDKQWKDGRQHDAQEFLRSILGAMQTELNRVKGKPPYKELKGEGSVKTQADEAWDYAHSRSSSVIQDVFAGQLQSTLQCPACGALSHTFDEFMDLSLPLPQESGLSVRSPTCTIQECLDAFTETETLEEEEGYNCQACKRKGVRATKKLTLYRCPPVLVLHLKRFSSSNGSLGMFNRFSPMSKDTTQVDVVADKLDLSPYCSEAARKQARPPLYRLSAVTNHSGSLAGGHYTAQCRSVLDDKWYKCNDSSVREDACIEGPSSSAYVLFYRQQD